MLDSRKGEALLAVIDTGSFDSAAALLHLTTSAVSQRVAALEEELGAILVVRGRPCRATREGEQLVQYLRRARLLEADYLAARDGSSGQPVSIPIATNNDTLETWLLTGIADFLAREHIVLEITLDDQDHTYDLLAQGQALAAVSSHMDPMRGCTAEKLGSMRYRMLASPAFIARWFADGFTRDAARRAPLLVFNRKDDLQAEFLQRVLGLPPGSYPCHYLPASGPFLRAVELGIGYAMVPEQQYLDRLERGALADLAPGKYTDVPLYWHAWTVQSPALERLSAAIIAAAHAALRQDVKKPRTRRGS